MSRGFLLIFAIALVLTNMACSHNTKTDNTSDCPEIIEGDEHFKTIRIKKTVFPSPRSIYYIEHYDISGKLIAFLNTDSLWNTLTEQVFQYNSMDQVVHRFELNKFLDTINQSFYSRTDSGKLEVEKFYLNGELLTNYYTYKNEFGTTNAISERNPPYLSDDYYGDSIRFKYNACKQIIQEINVHTQQLTIVEFNAHGLVKSKKTFPFGSFEPEQSYTQEYLFGEHGNWTSFIRKDSNGKVVNLESRSFDDKNNWTTRTERRSDGTIKVVESRTIEYYE
jgi:hypothetical protein